MTDHQPSDFERSIFGDTAPAQAPNHKVIPPKQSPVKGDDLAEAILGPMMSGVLIAIIMKDDPEGVTKALEDLASDAAARFRGRVLAGEATL